MDRAMTGMCIGEKRKLVIPPNLGFKDGHKQAGETLYYVVQLVDLFRAVPGLKWVEDDGLSIEVVHKIDEDECIKSAPGDTIHQQYNLQLADSTWIDSSFDRKEPYIFRLGAKKVIEGIDRAMTNMCEGEHRKVIVPPHLGYGLEGSPPKIPGNATLHFYIILEKLIKKDEL
uniref:peptidylprolyl isomerase n=1 Tax=Acrobeloides nanus TaxID=290746 RepID=A0A914C3T9_9BILA